MDTWSLIASHIARAAGREVAVIRARSVAGGNINRAAIVDTSAGEYFVKLGPPEREDMFAAEAEALKTIQRTGVIRVPNAICWGSADGMAFSALECLSLVDARGHVQEKLGRRLAALHRVTQRQFGWHRDNSIGATPQLNAYASDWVEFFRERRLRFQLTLAARNGYADLAARAQPLLERLHVLFSGYRCSASLLHGDLWYGNTGAAAGDEPVIFDPALYFGDHECDLAMTKLFGGFSDSFYGAYEAEWPLAAGYETRCVLYQWYHVLNHLNMFGASYLRQANEMLFKLLSELG